MTDINSILFGVDDTPNIVAVEPSQGKMLLFIRTPDGVATEEREFNPWLLTDERVDLPYAGWMDLDGTGYNHLATFPNWNAFQSARFRLRDQRTSHFAYNSQIKQYLMRSGQTLFKGMTFQDIHRLQIDLETAGFNPDDPESAIILVSVTDNRGNQAVLEGPEDEILQQLVQTIRDIDPDVIEGHNIYNFDLPYLSKRAQLNNIRLELGRDGSVITFSAERNSPVGGITRPFIPAYIFGRHIVDTLLGVQRYDVARGNLTSHALKSVTVQLGLSEEDRVYIRPQEVVDIWRTDPDKLKKYCLQDALECRSLSELVSPAEFYLTQMVPDSYSAVVTTGTGEKINSIMIREYLRQGKAIPRSQPPRVVPGGYTEVKKTGLIRGVVKCDVESLYPSLMLSQKIGPASDTLNIFLPALEELTRRRLEAKAKARTCKGLECTYWDGLQGSFKILINSFYGYLGAAPFQFNDYDAAEKITLGGQQIVKQVVEELERTGSEVIEIDTDGVYFKPPSDEVDLEAEVRYIERINGVLPEGIRLAHDGRYRVMLSFKVKNYILVGYEGNKIFHGSSIRSRADERFGRDFISKAVDLLLDDKPEEVAELYKSFSEQIRQKKLPLESFSRRERITEKTFSSSAKKRMAAAVGEDARVGDYVTVYQRQDGSLALAEDYANDEDTKYYLEKLHKFASRIKEAFGEDFERLFPKPTKKRIQEAAGQQELLF